MYMLTGLDINRCQKTKQNQPLVYRRLLLLSCYFAVAVLYTLKVFTFTIVVLSSISLWEDYCELAILLLAN